MKIHLIAIGGSIMHNLAITLQKAGHTVTGSDDEIYNPARDRLESHGLLPHSMGWNPSRIDTSIDLIILGMHARIDNPELIKAQEFQIPIMSFPEFVYQQSLDKKRIVVTGSHGKTTTTSMILHVLKIAGFDFDYLVGAQLNGFETMVQVSDAPLLVAEGDEYLSSCLDRKPKILHYRPHIAVITGIAWDHMNVFPTFKSYKDAFSQFLSTMDEGGKVYFDESDEILTALVRDHGQHLTVKGYRPFQAKEDEGTMLFDSQEIELDIFGEHNMANLKAAYLVLKDIGITDNQFLDAIGSFKGAAKRLQILVTGDHSALFQDFAHAPSKVKASIKAVKKRFPKRKLTAVLELHTYSSLNKEFLPQYKDTMQDADQGIIFVNDHTLQMKKMAALSDEEITSAFGDHNLRVIREKDPMETLLKSQEWNEHNLLLMTSGTLGGLDLNEISDLFSKR
jgi:UDP-N-acetylmuramate: L-alanyl-gamma-D-glutamyl-meso-diaminopimelate ligase